jgi:hypothetical protein
MVDEELLFFLGEVVKPEHALTAEPGTLHDAIGFEFICRDDGTTSLAGVCDNAHG